MLYILAKNWTFYLYDYCRTILLLYVLTTLVWDPEDGDSTQICSGKGTLNYTIHRTVHLLVLIQVVIHNVQIIWNCNRNVRHHAAWHITLYLSFSFYIAIMGWIIVGSWYRMCDKKGKQVTDVRKTWLMTYHWRLNFLWGRSDERSSLH